MTSQEECYFDIPSLFTWIIALPSLGAGKELHLGLSRRGMRRLSM
jgi:hypothetical protein